MAVRKETLLAEFKAASGRKAGNCGFKTVRATLTSSAGAALDEAMEDEEVSVAGIVKVLEAWGTPIGRNQVRDHRCGACACHR